MDFLIKGIIVGLGLNLLLGPIFIILTQTAIDKGVKAGMYVAAGIWISDLLFALLCFLFLPELVPITDDPRFKLYVGFIGGVVLILIGAKMILKSLKEQENTIETIQVKGKYIFKLALQGFLINTINPFSVFFWIGVFTTIIYRDKANNMELMFFLIGVLGIIFIFDILKVVLAEKIRKYLNEKRMVLFNRYAGVLFVMFGIVLIMRSI